MSDAYTKLFASITESTIWSEPAGTRLVWITMLAKCNRKGEVFGSVPGFARLANVTLEECQTAIDKLLAPDTWSRTTDHEGRRIEAIDGGWRILNHAKFDKLRSEIEAQDRERDRKREWDRENRPSGHARGKQSDASPSESDASPSESAPPPALALEDQDQEQELLPPSHQEPHARDPASAPGVCVQAAIALRNSGKPTTPQNPDLIAAAAEGVTVAELTSLAELYPGKPASYVIAAARRQRAEGASPTPRARAGPRQCSGSMSKMATAIATLEGMKHGKAGRGMVPRCNPDGIAETRTLESG